MDFSIIIVNYKSKGLTLNCVKSIREADLANLKYEVIVVDNASGDGVGEALAKNYSEVKFIQNKKNLGMGAGNNVGIREARGKYIAIMNPDIIVFKDTFRILFTYMENNPDVGLVGPQQLNSDQTLQFTCFRWYNFMTFFYRRTFLGKTKRGQKDVARFEMRDFDHQTEKEVDWLRGSFLFCRYEALRAVGLFDEQYFMYLEDTDLCRRFWQNKFRVVYYPVAKAIHDHARQSARVAWYNFIFDKTARYHFVSWIKYLWKWKLNN